MQLEDIFANLADQDKGRWLDIINPFEGTPTGIRLLVAGPDGDVQRRARIALMDGLADAARPDGTVSFADREAARIDMLARCVIGWELPETDAGRLSFGHRNVARLLKVAWIEQQVDAFAADRTRFRPGGV
ncbi:hypothetical protein ACRC7T_18480 [Segnochrobactraceae bacterium EtOH-i3]